MAYEFNHYYELQNVATGKYVNVLGNHEDGTVKNGETVNLFNRTNNPDQRWALENYGGNGNVRIVLQRGEGWYALNYNTRNANCIVWHLNTADDIDTVIAAVQVESLTDTYYLKLRDRDTYLFAVTLSAPTATADWNGRRKAIDGAAATAQHSPSKLRRIFSCKASLPQ